MAEGFGFTNVLDIPDELTRQFKVNFLNVTTDHELIIETSNGKKIGTKLSNVFNLEDCEIIKSITVKPSGEK